MGKLELTFTRDKVTPGTFRFKEDAPAGVRPTVGSIYVLKDKLPADTDKIRVTIEKA
jgi:hypothetical protein